MDTYTAHAIDGGLNAALTRRQFALLCMAARRAFDEQVRVNLVDPGVDFASWRHAEQLRVIGVSSLRVARQRHYRPMMAHWQDLAGNPMSALRSRIRATMDKSAQARAKVRAECEAAASFFGGAAGARQYADGFLRHKRGVSIDEASAADLWHAVFVIRRRVGQFKRKPAISEQSAVSSEQ